MSRKGQSVKGAIAALSTPAAPEPLQRLLVGLEHGAGFFSGAIEWLAGGYFSHYTTVLPSDSRYVIDARNDGMTIDGDWIKAGVQRRPVSYLKDSQMLWLELSLPGPQARAVECALRSQIDKPYDKVGILAFATGKYKNYNWRDESAWFCSELGIWALEQAGVCNELPLTPNRITPGDGALVVGALGAKHSLGPGIPV
jgi:hypothetical protein